LHLPAAPVRPPFTRTGTIKKQPILNLLALALGAAAAVVSATSLVRPIFFQRAPVVSQILKHAYVDSTAIHAPWLSSPIELALRTPQFLADRERFAKDLLQTGKVEEPRAWRLADVAVSEAYRRRLPPALVLGVMMTENDQLKSNARSKVGAVGLMQVHARHWRGALGRLFGTDLKNDTTNLRYGVYILSYMAQRAAVTDDAGDAMPDVVASDSSWRTALLRYNGCVRGTNTPNCRMYPVAVRRNVMRMARTTCNGRDFNACVSMPLWLATRSRGATGSSGTLSATE
jgi:soluble lytic murein transglycosylase-like protein